MLHYFMIVTGVSANVDRFTKRKIWVYSSKATILLYHAAITLNEQVPTFAALARSKNILILSSSVRR
jgi:hypothetical protein